MAMIQQSDLLRVCTGVLAVIAALFVGCYALWILVEAGDRNGSPGGSALILVAGSVLLLFSGVILGIGIKRIRAQGAEIEDAEFDGNPGKNGAEVRT